VSQRGRPIVSSWEGMPGTTGDVVLIASAGAADDDLAAVSAFAYTGGGVDGSATFYETLPAGDYEIRGLQDDTWTVVGRASFTVIDIDVDAPHLYVHQTVVPRGEDVGISYENLNDGPGGWIGLFAADAGRWNYSLDWSWTTGATTASGQLPTARLAEGDYVVRAYNERRHLLAEDAFTIGPAGPPPLLSTDADVYGAGQDIAVLFSGLEGHDRDRLAIVASGADLSDPTSYTAVSNPLHTSGSLVVTAPAVAGIYEIRAYKAYSLQLDGVSAPFEVAATGAVVEVLSGTQMSCVLDAAGLLDCWSDVDPGGQLSDVPTVPVSAASLSDRWGCAVLASDGTLECWGYDLRRPTFTPGGSYVDVAAGEDHACALDHEGAMVCWGSNNEGQVTGPQAAGDGWRAVSAGRDLTCALHDDGHLACWGADRYGQDAPPSGSFETLAVETLHGCALRTDGDMACWGQDYLGKAPADRAGPYIDVDVGHDFTCGLLDSGDLDCFGGLDMFGQLSDVPASPRFDQLSLGYLHGCARVQGGSEAVCWGWDAYGQLP